MKKRHLVALLTMVALLLTVPLAARTRVRVKRGPHGHVTRVTVSHGFPIHRTLPAVVVRPGPVLRVTPRVYLAPVVFGAVVVASLPAPDHTVWSGETELEREDGWTDFTVDVDRRGDRMLLQVGDGPARISFAEIVFENGDTQVVDFDDRVQSRGIYSLADFKDGRKIDHVRMVAKAEGDETDLTLHLTN